MRLQAQITRSGSSGEGPGDADMCLGCPSDPACVAKLVSPPSLACSCPPPLCPLNMPGVFRHRLFALACVSPGTGRLCPAWFPQVTSPVTFPDPGPLVPAPFWSIILSVSSTLLVVETTSCGHPIPFCSRLPGFQRRPCFSAFLADRWGPVGRGQK